MDETPVNIIRESTRSLLKLNRRINKDDENDARRLLGNKSVSSERITEIANNLKNKSLISTQDLQLLKNSLIDNKENLNIVLSTQGALRGLVRELSGSDVKRQCAAAGCFCNLALGDSKSCGAVAKTAGSYLIAALDSLTAELSVTCAWAIGNMAGSGPRVCELLAAQGAPTKLVELLRGHEDIRDAALYALVRFAYQLKDDLRTEHLEKILDALYNLESSMASSQLLFILSCHNYFDRIECPDPFLQKLLKTTTVSTGKHLSTCKGDQCCDLVYLIRTLANFVISDNSTVILHYFMAEDVFRLGFPKILLSKSRILVESLLWLLGVLYKYCDQNEFFTQIMDLSG